MNYIDPRFEAKDEEIAKLKAGAVTLMGVSKAQERVTLALSAEIVTLRAEIAELRSRLAISGHVTRLDPADFSKWLDTMLAEPEEDDVCVETNPRSEAISRAIAVKPVAIGIVGNAGV